MLPQLSSRERKTLAAGIGAIGAIVTLGRGIPAMRRWEADRVAVAAEVHHRLEEADRGARMIDALRDSTAVSNGRLLGQATRLVQGTTIGTASAALGSLVQAIADESGVQVGMMALAADSSASAGLSRVSARLAADGDVTAIVNFLAAVESNEVPLSISQLAITQNEPAAPSTRPEALHCDVVVETIANVVSATHGTDLASR